ncbi:hypothetical protein AAMO2058_001236400 [Amorphochlora amoebiformis]
MDGKEVMRSDQQMILLASLQAKTFMDLYTSVADSQRENLFRFYRKNSVLIWNGTSLNGAEIIFNALKKLPRTRHKIESLDAQPIITSLEKKHTSLLISSSGKVKFGNQNPVKFYQSFVLERNPDKNDESLFYVLSHTFRYQDTS